MADKTRENVLAFWKSNNIYEKVKKASAKRKKFYFLDGPPYATGFIHMGTAWNKILKDVFIRFWRMQGFDVWDQPGYDTHGVPIEKKVEQELGFRSKGDIEKFGVEEFNIKCREFATKFIGTMNREFADLGVWMDWSRPYLTLDRSYIEAAWATFKIAFEKGFLYRGLYSVHVCPACETAVSYNEIVYQKVTDSSVYVKFPLETGSNEYFVIWTTTPWTIPSNVGIMANPDATYVKVDTGSGILIVAKDLAESLMSRFGIENYRIIKSIKGRQLEGTRYVHPLRDSVPFIKKQKNAHRVVLSKEFVSLEEGTGLVHTAPGHGEEDYKVGVENSLPILNPLDLSGRFGGDSGRFSGVTAIDANKMIVEELKEKGLLLKEEDVTHDYPMCWRCSSKLLQMAVPQWFFRVTAIRDKLLKENEKIKWHPEWAGARFRNWLESLGDWPISRQRYWGIPLPIWVCDRDDSHIRVVSSSKELKKKISDLHRPYVDDILLGCNKCKGTMKRIPDVLDVWFDSSLASWAPLGWPEQMKKFRGMWPADLNIEGPDQIRGWWNSQFIASMIAFGKPPFKSVLLHGLMLDAAGAKMSKSKGNVIIPDNTIEKGFSTDALRLYLLSGPPWNDYYFSWDGLAATSRSLGIIRNTFNFVNTYVPRAPSKARLQNEDRWLMSRMNSAISGAAEAMKRCEPHRAMEIIRDFAINDFSRVYIKLVRDRVWPLRGKDTAAYYTLCVAGENLCRMLAPFMPFLAEELYQELKNPVKRKAESVHLTGWPSAAKPDLKLEEKMGQALVIAETANAIRSEHKIKLRWPLKEIVAGKEAGDAVKTFGSVIERLSNVKKVSIGRKEWQRSSDGINVWLDLKTDKELKREACVREIIRRIQDSRKKENMVVSDRIDIRIENADVKGFEKEIMTSVGAKSIGKIKDGQKIEMEFEGNPVTVIYRKA